VLPLQSSSVRMRGNSGGTTVLIALSCSLGAFFF
jgi:hypothetical protein